MKALVLKLTIGQKRGSANGRMSEKNKYFYNVDHLDSALIAYNAERVQLEPTKLKSQNIRLMSDLVTKHNQRLTMQIMKRNRPQILPKNISSTITLILAVLKIR